MLTGAGRNCSSPAPDTHHQQWDPNEWCEGAWDTSNVRAFLQYIHDNNLFGGASPLSYFELGNELVTHLAPSNNTADINHLVDIIAEIWDGASARPPLVAPSTDSCTDPGTAEIMKGINGHAQGFSYHAYPGGSVSGRVGQPTMEQLLTNVTWLRTGILHGSEAMQCISDFTRVVGPVSIPTLHIAFPSFARSAVERAEIATHTTAIL